MQSGNSDDGNPCADRWKNMINDVTSKMWGIFDETGVFLALCRHGFVLVLTDMIRSGELAKYPLAVVKELLDAFGLKIGAGYDVGCHFGATIDNSELGDEAREKKLRCLVGSFHGHAHNRLCQLRFLATYVEGMGLEDLEGCERFFSRSNGLAKSCRYASRFHRQQEISTYVKHFDSFETYANLGKFLTSNYRQALTILRSEPALKVWMRSEGVDGYGRFHEWLQEEKTYLVGLKNAPKTNVETLEMEYVQKLVNLSTSQAKHAVVVAEARCARADDAAYQPGVPKAELARRQGRERMEKDLDSVLELEAALDIVERWTTASPKWVATAEAVKKRRYQLALDALELLIVERIFELTKMNQSQTGYKMRKHIAKALQAQSKAVRSTIEQYNTAAVALSPPMPMLNWEQVVEFLQKMEAKLRETKGKSEEQVDEDVQLAVQVRLYRERRGRFDNSHMRRFYKLASEPGFTGSLQCGVAVERGEIRERLRELRAQAARDAGEMDVDGEEDEEEGWVDVEFEAPPPGVLFGDGEDDSDGEGEGDQAKDAAVSDLVYQISMIAVDGEGARDTE
ncbi:hypothetical protein DFH09DRAFT_1110926 [Mycena vulgaris]|nr:hypothetical protein DFH09DRAFT_1110926 [Mycena vulgaris]